MSKTEDLLAASSHVDKIWRGVSALRDLSLVRESETRSRMVDNIAQATSALQRDIIAKQLEE